MFHDCWDNTIAFMPDLTDKQMGGATTYSMVKEN